LSNLILAPVASKLEKRTLLIVPDGALQYLPFQVLTVPIDQQSGVSQEGRQADDRVLITDHEIVIEPSASVLALLVVQSKNRKAPSHTVAVLADPVFEANDSRLTGRNATNEVQETGLQLALRDVNLVDTAGRIPRLPASLDEAKAIMSVTPWHSGFQALGFEANREAATRSNLGEYRIVHFATHGLLNDKHPELSGIVLSLFDDKGQPQDGFLRLHDIYNLNLPVELVVLSACNTGLGKDVRGEGLIGLTRGFMYAGASSVVASLWKVDDEATAELMKRFYSAMLEEGLPPAAALRKAQLEMSKQKRWQSPYFWAGFVIQGQYNQTQQPVSSSKGKTAILGGLACFLLLAMFFFWKRRRSQLL
jgi:CHAT domain-containing protein